MNPLDILYSWHSALLSVVIVGLTQSFKASLEAYLVFKNTGSGKSGKVLRQEIVAVNKVLLPLFPIVLGAFLASFVPLHPEGLVQYVRDHAPGSRTPFALWGAAIGQFADYLYSKTRDFFPKSPAGTPSSSIPPVASGSNPPETPVGPAAEAEVVVAPTTPDKS